MTFAEAAPLYTANDFEVLPVRGKHIIPTGSTGKSGLIDDEKIAAWMNDPEWNGGNLAIRLPSNVITIDIDHYDDKHGADQIAELEAVLGPLPATVTSTARGQDSPSRQMFYEVPEGLEFVGSVSRDVEVIQRGHRFVVAWPSRHVSEGTTYTFYDADGEPFPEGSIPSKDDFERLPEAWLDHITKAKRGSNHFGTGSTNAAQHQGFPGAITEWLESCEPGEMSFRVKEWKSRVKVEDFNHEDVTRITYNLVRLGAEREPGVPEAMAWLRATWVKPPYDEDRYVKELDLAIQGAIRKAGQFSVTRDSLPDFFEAQALLPNPWPTDLERLMGAEHGDIEDLIHELLRLGLDERDTASLALRAPLGKPFENDFQAFWRKVLDVQASFQHEQSVPASEQQEAEQAGEKTIKYRLVTDDERAKVAQMENWQTKYVQIAETMVADGYLNLPYHKGMSWVVGATAFGNNTLINRKPKRMPLNIFVMSPGESSTGKSDADKIRTIIQDAIHGDRFWSLGADFSTSAMHKKLIEGEGGARLIHHEEAAKPFQNWFPPAGKFSTFSDVPTMLTSWYDGYVAPIHRVSEKEVSGISTEVCLSASFFGTPDRVFDIISESEFLDGFFARFIWLWGNEPKSDVTEYNISFYDDDDEATGGVEASLERFAGAARAHMGNDVKHIGAEPDARQRLVDGGKKIANLFNDHPAKRLLKPSSIRMVDTVWKCCGILAAAEGMSKITLDQAIFVLAEAEEWLVNVERVVGMLNNSEHSRRVGKLMELMTKTRKTHVPETLVFQHFSHLDAFDVNKIINSALKQGLIKDHQEGQNTFYMKIQEDKK